MCVPGKEIKILIRILLFLGDVEMHRVEEVRSNKQKKEANEKLPVF